VKYNTKSSRNKSQSAILFTEPIWIKLEREGKPIKQVMKSKYINNNQHLQQISHDTIHQTKKPAYHNA
jgi:hypothetical protein